MPARVVTVYGTKRTKENSYRSEGRKDPTEGLANDRTDRSRRPADRTPPQRFEGQTIAAAVDTGCMPNPRPTYEHTTTMVTRRCSERRFFLQPSPLVTLLFKFLVAVAAWRTGVQLHALTVLSNHYHLVASDPNGNIPEFYGYLHSLLARCLNASRGRFEAMWSSEETNRVSLEDADAIVRQVGYTLSNPTTSGLVARSALWPGVRMFWKDAAEVIERPDFFFDDDGELPETAVLVFVPPPQLAELPDQGIALVEAECERLESKMQRRARTLGRRFLGLAAICSQHWNESPTTFAKRRGLRPRVATRSTWRRIAALQRNKRFEADYADVRERFLAGERDLIWPYGTYKMCVTYGFAREPRPAAFT